MFLGLIAIGILGILCAVPYLPMVERYFFAGVGAVIGYLCFFLFWFPYRSWARPPIAFEVSTDGLDFWVTSGRRTHVPWSSESLRIELLEGPERAHPSGATNRIWLVQGPADFIWPWRRIVPLKRPSTTPSTPRVSLSSLSPAPSSALKIAPATGSGMRRKPGAGG